MPNGQKIVRSIAIVLSVLAGIGLVVSMIPLAFLTPTPPPENSPSDFPADFQFEIASTSEARTQGLSGRPDVPPNYGLLFVFDEPGRYGFWMNEMLVPIDVLWIDEDGTVVGIEESVSPDTFPTVFHPPANIQYVLEMRAGEAKRLGIKEGARIPLPNQ